MAKSQRLGRGLDGFFDSVTQSSPTRSRPPGNVARIEDVFSNRSQPRQFFNPEGLAELAASIKEHGLLEPILVRKRDAGGFEIIAGERRWRAAQQAGLREVPIFVRELSDAAAFEAALVENLQREDLNPIETAKAFQRLIDEYKLSQEKIATRIGKDRSTVANALRLLKLPDTVMELLETGDLSEGHGRALLMAADDKTIRMLAAAAVKEDWSVRETERRARRGGSDKSTPTGVQRAPDKTANVRDLERRLTTALGTTVSVVETSKGRGHLSIRFGDYDELDRIISKIVR